MTSSTRSKPAPGSSAACAPSRLLHPAPAKSGRAWTYGKRNHKISNARVAETQALSQRTPVKRQGPGMPIRSVLAVIVR